MAGELKAEEAHDALEHYIALKLTILGVVQGLAFTHLADRFPEHGSVLRYILFSACVLIVIRVFQTYATAAVEKSKYLRFRYFDLISMFLVGLLEYWIFDAADSKFADAKDFS